MPTKVFFCETIDEGIVSRGFECPDKHFTRMFGERTALTEWEARPTRLGGFCVCSCGKQAAQVSAGWSPLYKRSDTGEIIGGKSKLPPGACYDSPHYHDWRTGPDGRSLSVVLPNGDHWFIDNRASNCTKPEDKIHRCWIRHGRPEDGTLHVDKAGDTCTAGAGSIAVDGYHGFLHNGYLTDGC